MNVDLDYREKIESLINRHNFEREDAYKILDAFEGDYKKSVKFVDCCYDSDSGIDLDTQLLMYSDKVSHQEFERSEVNYVIDPANHLVSRGFNGIKEEEKDLLKLIEDEQNRNPQEVSSLYDTTPHRDSPEEGKHYFEHQDTRALDKE
jgi:hypothetical protein|tara:strand:+ start:1198 stop:1641 length:444 start_codon:yes stop_codon:yes gene_type:complete